MAHHDTPIELAFRLTVRAKGHVPPPEEVAKELTTALANDGFAPQSFDLVPLTEPGFALPWEPTHVSVDDGSPVRLVAVIVENEDGDRWQTDPADWTAMERT